VATFVHNLVTLFHKNYHDWQEDDAVLDALETGAEGLLPPGVDF
jgi:hypothetical protein